MLWLVLVYLLISIGIGLYGASRVHNAKDFITAGRNMPMAVVIAMVFATWFGAETVLGVSATFLEEGLRGLISDPFGAAMCLVIFGLIFARPLYRMGLTTLAESYCCPYALWSRIWGGSQPKSPHSGWYLTFCLMALLAKNLE